VTLGVYSEVFDTEIATAIGRINDALGGKADLESIEGSSDRSREDTRDGGGSRRKLTLGTARLRYCQILCQTASPEVGRGRFRWWAILGLNQ
jgi:hypothetical protein